MQFVCFSLVLRGSWNLTAIHFEFVQMTVYANGVSVLMPGDNIPTFIALPAPVPCPPERPSYPHNQQHINQLPNPTANPDTNSSSSSISTQQN